jgi:hypothetical protein
VDAPNYSRLRPTQQNRDDLDPRGNLTDATERLTTVARVLQEKP